MPSIWITGASTGFGKNTALALAQEGWQVYASMRNLDKADAVRQEAEQLGVAEQLQYIQADVTSSESITEACAKVLEGTGGNLDALFNCAGHTPIGAFEEMSEEEYRRVMDTNFFGVLAATQSVLPVMREAGKGRIVVVSSNAVNTPHPLMSLYAASKWALEGWAEALALEIEPYGLKVSVVQPGAHRTPFGSNTTPLFSENSAYLKWLEAAGEGLQDLDKWGRDPHKATDDMLSAIRDPNPLFRYHVGEDAQFFNWLKGNCPFEVRAWVCRAIAGLPGENTFTEKTEQARESTNISEIADKIIGAANKDPAKALDMITRLAALQR